MVLLPRIETLRVDASFLIRINQVTNPESRGGGGESTKSCYKPTLPSSLHTLVVAGGLPVQSGDDCGLSQTHGLGFLLKSVPSLRRLAFNRRHS